MTATPPVLAADIGGSFIRVARVAGAAVEALGRAATPARDWDRLVSVLAALLDGAGPGGLGVAVAGVPGAGGGVLAANIPCLADRPVAAELSLRLGRPVTLANDADCFALAEAAWGAGRGHGVVLGVVLGSGVGGGLVVDGRLVPGAGEWGHGPVVRAGPLADQPCPCGQRGCLDGVASARGIERLHRALGREAVDSRAILAGWAAGDAGCADTVAAWLDAVAGPLALAVNLVAATVVPVGGGLGQDGALVAALDGAVRARVLRGCGGALVVPAALDADAGLVGAGLIAPAPGVTPRIRPAW